MSEARLRVDVAVDLVIVTALDSVLKVLLVQRRAPPCAGAWSLPGGFVWEGERLEEAAHRELHAKTHLPRGACPLVQVGAMDDPARDPRGRVLSVAYAALVRQDLAALTRAGDAVRDAAWRPLDALDATPLAFDHAAIVQRAMTRLRDQLAREDVALELVPPTFTVAELRAAYSALDGQRQDPGNFRRRFHKLLDLGRIAPAEGERPTSTRPAKVYRAVS